MPRSLAESRRNATLLKGFAKRLQKAREAVGFPSAQDFARRLMIEGARYRKYERGDSMPPPAILEQIAELTEKSLDYLILGKKK